MNTSTDTANERVKEVRTPREILTVSLGDWRVLSVPLSWYPRLAKASDQDRAEWQICGAGFGIYWPKIDEHLSIEGLLRGAPSPSLTAEA